MNSKSGAMAETLTPKKELEDLQEDLQEVQELLRRYELVEALLENHGDTPAGHAAITKPTNDSELRAKLERMHPADIAYVLEALPLDERIVVWDLVKADRDGEILLEVSDAVRETLIQSMDTHELVAAAEQLDAQLRVNLLSAMHATKLAAQHMKERGGGKIVLLTDDHGMKDNEHKAFRSIRVPKAHPFISPLLYAVPVQLLAYHAAVFIGTDVDQPRNLAKSVTVE